MNLLKQLHVENFALIDECNLDFHCGFTAFTGETGAGKSLLIDAISLLCGERASASFVQRGKQKAVISGLFSLDNVKVFGNLEENVKRIAICPGSGKSVIKTALSKNADVLVTGDIGHHDGIDAVAQGLAIIDAGHYGIEHIFIKDMEEYLKRNLDGVEVVTEEICHPFVVV